MNEIYFRAAIVADALSLGPHWIYNQSRLARLYPDGVRVLTDPASEYHPNRSAGDLTHYGDQTVWLRDAIRAQSGAFEVETWRNLWCERMRKFDGYVDGASKDTLASEGRTASGSNDLAGASRLAPLLDLDLSLQNCVHAARAQTALTHGDVSVADAAEFVVQAVFAVREGADFQSAFTQAAQEGRYSKLDISEAISSAWTASDSAPLTAASALGLTCQTTDAFPLTLYFARVANDFAEAISLNGLAGGDTSARAMLLAVLFAAKDGDVGEPLAAEVSRTTGAL